MKESRERVQAFMASLDMDHRKIDLNQECQIFVKEMEKGLKGQDSSLQMIPTYISMHGEVAVNEPVIVIDAGGTNFRVAVVHFDQNKQPVIEDFQMYTMPGTQGEISKKEFFETIVGYLKPVLHKSDKIGFCFSYATQIQPNKDGRLIRFSKEVSVRDLEGELIGDGLLKAMEEAGYTEKKSIVLLNDTVATLLGGRAATLNRTFDSYIGFILGTGTNTCYVEDTSSIEKLNGQNLDGGTILINVESGSYGKAPRGQVDAAFDSTTANPGQYMFEKMIAGGYQGSLILALLREAAAQGLLSEEFGRNLQGIPSLGTPDVNAYLYFPYGNNPLACCSQDTDGKDKEILFYLIDAVVERAAKLTTVNLASTLIKSGKGQDPTRPVCIAADGSTFYKLKHFKSKLDYYVKEFIEGELGIYCEFIKAENSTLTGSAIAAF